MKRHPALEPFSRDHNVGLTSGRSLERADEGSAEGFKRLWRQELCDHFDQEESLLGPLLDESRRQRLTVEHERIRRLNDCLPETGPELGQVLIAHIRWEERELFPWIEQNATERQLAALADATDAVEQSRWPHCARRKRLVQRRRQQDNPNE